MPKVKQIQKTEVPRVDEELVARSYEEMIKLAFGRKLDSKTLNMKEAVILVDSLGIDDRNAKAHAKRVDAGKPVLLEYAKDKGLRVITGIKSEAEAKDSTSYFLPASKAIKILEKEGKTKLLDSVLKVSVDNFRKYLGDDLYDSSAKKEVVPFRSISIKQRKGVEGEEKE